MMSRAVVTVVVVVVTMVPASRHQQPGSGLSYLMSPANTVSCRDKDKQLLEEVESAQLAAHRSVL